MGEGNTPRTMHTYPLLRTEQCSTQNLPHSSTHLPRVSCPYSVECRCLLFESSIKRAAAKCLNLRNQSKVACDELWRHHCQPDLEILDEVAQKVSSWVRLEVPRSVDVCFCTGMLGLSPFSSEVSDARKGGGVAKETFMLDWFWLEKGTSSAEDS